MEKLELVSIAGDQRNSLAVSRRYLRSCPTIAGPYGNDLKNDTLRQEWRASMQVLTDSC